jgi:DNA-binding IclR family transcriptional regulator
MTAADDEKDRHFAGTLAHGIDLLLCFKPGETSLANKDFALRTGLSRPTVARLTHTLTVLGYLRHDTVAARYRLGAAVLGVSHPLLASMRIRPIARPLMEMLAREIEGAVSLGVRDRIHMVYVESARGTDELQTLPDIGSPLPMMATAIGRAWLAHASASDRRAVLNQLRLADAAQFERHSAAVEEARLDLARDGFCSSRAEWRPEAHGFAVPLRGIVDNTQFVLNCGVLARRGGFAQLRRSVAPKLVSLARSVEVLLGLR